MHHVLTFEFFFNFFLKTIWPILLKFDMMDLWGKENIYCKFHDCPIEAIGAGPKLDHFLKIIAPHPPHAHFGPENL